MSQTDEKIKQSKTAGLPTVKRQPFFSALVMIPLLSSVGDQRMLALYAPHVAPVAARSWLVEETASFLPKGGSWGNVAQSVIVSVSVRNLTVDVNAFNFGAAGFIPGQERHKKCRVLFVSR